MIITANAAVGRPWAHHAIAILAGFTAGAVFLFGVFDMTAPGNPVRNAPGVDIGIMVTAAVAAALASKPVREWLARYMPVNPDNPVHSYALVLAVILIGTQIAPLAFTDVLTTVSHLQPLTIGDLFAQEIPFAIIAAAGVGIYIRRSPKLTAERLGVVRPQWWHVTMALAAAGALWGVNLGAGWLSHALTPTLAGRVDSSSNHLFGGLINPAGIAAIAVLPGICEELLFRGALQPRFGLLATAALFTAIHTDYGLTIDLLTIFLLAIALGLIRRYANTTSSITCHATYNLLVGLGLTGFGAIGVGAAAVVLVAVTALEVQRRRQAEPVVSETQAVR